MDFKEALGASLVKIFDLTNNEVLEKIVQKDAVDIMEQLVATPAFSNAFKENPDLLNSLFKKVCSYKMLAVLLRNGLDLVKAYPVEEKEHSVWCITFMLSDTLKVKVNPNARVNNSFKTPLWRYMFTENSVKLGWLKIFANGHKNLTEPLDVNAVDKDGETHLHVRRDIFPEIFELNPDLEIKNSAGRTVIEERNKRGFKSDAFDRYRFTNDEIKKLKNLLIATQEELSKTKEKLKNIESVLS